MCSARRGALVTSLRVCTLALVGAVAAGDALAHGGSLGSAAGSPPPVPTWLVVVTGGTAVGAAFLLTGFATDRLLVGAVHGTRRGVRIPAEGVLRPAARLVGIVALLVVLVVGFFGPADPLSNAAVAVVWVGWWAGYAMSTYLAGNSWPLVNPWRTLSRALPQVGREYDWRYGAWPGVAGLLALVWLETVGPVADRPRVLATVVLAYSVVTLAGASVYGTATWFGSVDPIARAFRYYGRVAPVTGDGSGGLSVRLPGAGLSEPDIVDGLDEVTFVIALLWVTIYDGLVTTPQWEAVATAAVGAGIPPAVLYPLALFVGFDLFVGLYLLAVRIARRSGGAAVEPRLLARRFAPPLLAVAAGFHLAHFLGYFLSLTPILAAAAAPFGAVTSPIPVYVLPDWFGVVPVGTVLVGYLLAVRTTHAAALDSGHCRGTRSRYPFVVAVTCYALVGLWVVTRPSVAPPFL